MAEEGMMKRWAAIGEEGEIIAVGVTKGRFDVRCLNLSSGGYLEWSRCGGRYAELLVDSLAGLSRGWDEPGADIKDVPHGRIRRSEEVLRL